MGVSYYLWLFMYCYLLRCDVLLLLLLCCCCRRHRRRRQGARVILHVQFYFIM
jgi:hypothetical protein